jgi:hypothetical protein
MSCLKGAQKAKRKSGNYRCEKCDAVAKKKKALCRGKKIKDD